jgi:methionine-rich copper-binding protein CopC
MKKLIFLLGCWLFTQILIAQASYIPLGIQIAKWLNTKESKTALFANKYYTHIWFAKALTAEQHEELRAAGISILDYLPEQKIYAVSIQEGYSIAKHRLEELPNAKLAINHHHKVSLLDMQKVLQPNSRLLVEYYKDIEPNQIVVSLANNSFFKVEKVYKELYLIELSCHHTHTWRFAKALEKLENAAWLASISTPSTPTLFNLPSKANSRSAMLDFGVRNLTGKGINVGIWDGGPSGWHIDFAGRHQYGEPTDFYAIFHGTHVTGTLGGAGNRDPQGRGNAPEANLVAYTLTTGDYIQYEMYKAVQNYNISVTQNSYGDITQCQLGGSPYTINDRTRDQLVTAFPYLAHVFAIGNSQNYCTGFATTAGNVGKNTITVGAISPDDQMTNFSSWGPSRDGRIKPDITAVGAWNVYSTYPNDLYTSGGWNGTSMAAPVVSGIVAQLQQYYKQNNGNVLPPVALLKAVLCNGAKDLGNPNPDYKFGFGRVNALNAVKALEEQRYKIDQIAQNQTHTYTITVPAGATRLKVLGTWSDVAAPITTGVTLVNDLDIKVNDGTTDFLPWVLNPAQPNDVAVRGNDNRNNIEQITIDNPTAGTYTITVTGTNVPMGSQEYALTWQIDVPMVKVVYPAGNEKLAPATTRTIYWDAEGTTGTFDLEYSTDNGATWTSIATGVSNNFYDWTVPNVFTDKALVRVKNGTLSGVSEQTFTILGVPTINSIAGVNNGIQLAWTTVNNATSYDVLLFNNTTYAWQTVGNTATTNFTIPNLINGQTYWATVRAKNGANIIGERAYAFSAVPSGVGNAVDLAVQSFVAPTLASCNLRTANETITVQLQNAGTSPILAGTMINVQYQINGQSPVNEVFTLSADVAPAATVNYSFTQTANLAAIGTYNIVVTANLTADNLSANNQATLTIQNQPLPLPVITGNLNTCGNPTTLTAIVPITSYKVSNLTFAPTNTAAGTVVSLQDDDTSAAIDIGFNFKFFDKTHHQLYIASNGLVGFTGFGLDYINGSNIPSVILPNHQIAITLADLAPDLGGTVRYLRTGIAPNRKFIIDYVNVPIRIGGSTAQTVTVQVVLNENNSIEFHLTNVPAGVNKTIGVENEFGTLGTTVTGRNFTDWTATNEAYLFEPQNTTVNWLPNNETTLAINTATAGTYTVSYTSNGCTYSQSAVVSTTCDTTPPTLLSFTPTNNATNVHLNTQLVMNFDENVQAGTGAIRLLGGTSPMVINVATSFVNFAGKTVTVTLPNNLEMNKLYVVNIDNGAIKDFANNDFIGINNSTTWRFFTYNYVNKAPTLDAISNVTVSADAPPQNINLTGISAGAGESFQSLTITATSSNTAILPHPTVSYTNPNSTGTLTFTPQSNVGTVTMTVKVKDDGGTANGGIDEIVRTFTIDLQNPTPPPPRRPQTITVQPIGDKVFGEPPFKVIASTTSGLPLRYTVTQGRAGMLGNECTLFGVGNGTVTITVSQEGNNSFLAAEPVSLTFRVRKASQRITFDSIPDKFWNDPAFFLAAQASSKLPVSFTIVSGKATLFNNVVSLQAATGRITIRATQTGNEDYEAATPVERSFMVNKIPQQLSIQDLGFVRFGMNNVPITATSSSKLPVSLTVKSGKVTLNNNLLTPTGAGSFTLRAEQNGDDFYLPASVEATFVVYKAPQSITFPIISTQSLNQQSVLLNATSSANLPITYTVVQGNVTLQGNTLNFNNFAGNVVIRATQNGNEDYEAAVAVERGFTILPVIKLTTTTLPNLCTSEMPTLQFETIGDFGRENWVSALLVATTGSFDNAVTVGGVSATTTGSISLRLPTNLPSGTYKLKLQTSQPFTESNESQAITITQTPTSPFIRFNGKVLESENTGQWLLNGKPVGSSSNSFSPTENGIYTQQVGTGKCLAISNEILVNIVPLGVNDDDLNSTLQVYPNPTNAILWIKTDEKTAFTAAIYDVLGKKLFSKDFAEGQTPQSLSLQDLPTGTYLLQIKTPKMTKVQKIVKE